MYRIIAIALPLCALLLVGCGGTGGKGRAAITRYPHWSFQDYKRIAVPPARAAKREAVPAADRLTDELTALLSGNSAFSVQERSALKGVLSEQDLSNLADVADPSTALPPGKIQIAQALVVAKITTYDLLRERREKRIPRYQVDQRGRRVLDRAGRPIVVGEDVHEEYMHGAVVGGTVRVIDAATGKILVSYTSPPLKDDATAWNRPPSASPEEIAAALVSQLATDFYKNVAPTQLVIKVHSNMLLIATDYYEGKYDEVSRVPSTGDSFMIVVRDLPKECDRNNFRVTLTPAEGREVLAEFGFAWGSARAREGLQFSVPVAKLRENGAISFTAKLFSEGDPEPVLTRTFDLELTKEEREARKAGAATK